MSDIYDHDTGEIRRRSLSNLQVLGFIGGFWMRRRGLLSAAIGLMLASVCFDLAMPWAARGLVDAVAAPHAIAPLAWRAWTAFVLVDLY